MKISTRSKSKFNMYFNASENIQKNAKELRKKMTHAEQALWNKLKKGSVKNFKFRRQHPIENFIADFYCHQAKLVIEIDGNYHNSPDQSEYDSDRSFEIEKYGLRVLRFNNDDVLHNVDFVIKKIEENL
jgi:very-short-patch-repair endonuclease